MASFGRLTPGWWIGHIILMIFGVVTAVLIMDIFHESRVIEVICLWLVCAFFGPLSIVIALVIHNVVKWNREKEKEFEAGIEKLKAANGSGSGKDGAAANTAKGSAQANTIGEFLEQEAVPELYVPVVADKKIFPVVTMNRIAYAFAEQSDAETYMKKNAGMLQGVTYRKITRQEFLSEMANWTRWGIKGVSVYSRGFQKNFQSRLQYKKDEEENARLLAFSYLMRAQTDHCLQRGSGDWKGTFVMTYHLKAEGMKHEAFLVAVVRDGESRDAGKDDRILRLFPGAAALQTKLLKEGKSLDFFGMKEFGYRFRAPGEAGDSKPMHGYTLINRASGQEIFPCFTDMVALKKIFPDMYVAAATWEDIEELSPNYPIILNPGELALPLEKSGEEQALVKECM